MAKSENLKDHENRLHRFSGCRKRAKLVSQHNKKYEIVVEELEHFEKLVEGHKKLLIAIGNL
jgi:hypothetical protein